jgi:hypothetical protein
MPAKYRFKAAERHAIWEAHHGICFLCRYPLSDYQDWDVDHLISESTSESELAALRTELDLPRDFTLNAFENWVPAHRACNRQKGSKNYRAPIFLTHIDLARKAGGVARKIEKAIKAKPDAERFFATLETRIEEFTSSPENFARLTGILQHFSQVAFTENEAGEVREVTSENSKLDTFPLVTLPITLTPGWTVDGIRRGDVINVRHESGRYGYMTINPSPDPSWICFNCGQHGIWNGARCMRCGMLQDD